MPDKPRERWYLERLRSGMQSFPAGPVVSGESPDFVVQSDDRTTGIEITQFYLPPSSGERPQQEQQSLKDRIVDMARDLHVNAGGPALYVSVYYRTPLALTKRAVYGISRALATAVLATPVPRSIEEPSTSVAWSDLPKEIANVRISGSIDGEDRLWYADAGGWVAPVEGEHIEQVIKRKMPMARAARAKCDELWLVIVNDEFSRAAPAQLRSDATDVGYADAFDRILWLEPHSQKVYEL
jgi:hypothetical protein